MLIYYAHPMTWYDKVPERFDVDYIKTMHFFDVFNPNQMAVDVAYKMMKMNDVPSAFADYFGTLVGRCDGLVYRAFDDGKIGSGVGVEIEAARRQGKPVWQISGYSSRRSLTPVMPDEKLDYLTRGETLRRCAEGVL